MLYFYESLYQREDPVWNVETRVDVVPLIRLDYFLSENETGLPKSTR